MAWSVMLQGSLLTCIPSFHQESFICNQADLERPPENMRQVHRATHALQLLLAWFPALMLNIAMPTLEFNRGARLATITCFNAGHR